MKNNCFFVLSCQLYILHLYHIIKTNNMEEGTLVMVKLDNDQNYKIDIFLAKMRRLRSKNEKTTKADELVRLAMIGLNFETKQNEK